MAEAGRRRSVAHTDRRENPSSIGRPDLKPVLLEIDAAQSSPPVPTNPSRRVSSNTLRAASLGAEWAG